MFMSFLSTLNYHNILHIKLVEINNQRKKKTKLCTYIYQVYMKSQNSKPIDKVLDRSLGTSSVQNE